MAQTQGGEEVQELVQELEREVRRLQGVVKQGTTAAGYLMEVNWEIPLVHSACLDRNPRAFIS